MAVLGRKKKKDEEEVVNPSIVQEMPISEPTFPDDPQFQQPMQQPIQQVQQPQYQQPIQQPQYPQPVQQQMPMQQVQQPVPVQQVPRREAYIKQAAVTEQGSFQYIIETTYPLALGSCEVVQ